MKIEAVLKKYTDQLMSLPGVIGTGEGLYKGKPCIKVFLIKRAPDLEKKIPVELEGYKVIIEETGTVQAYSGIKANKLS
jgi:hypothetical protein